MRIAIATFKYSPFGGLERDMLRLAEAAARRGHEVVIFTGYWQGDLPIIPGIKIEILSSGSLTNHCRARNFARQALPRIQAGHFDVSVAFNRIPGCDFYFAADNCYAVEMPKKHHRLLLKLLPRYRTYLRLERAIFAPESATRILYISPHQKRDYQACYQTASERFFLLPPGMNPDCRRPPEKLALAIREKVRTQLQLSAEEFMLLLVGSNFRQKGGDRAILALAALPKDLRQRCRLFFVGADRPGELGKLAQSHQVSEQVVFLGPRTDLPELLLGSDVLLLPARNEAAGSVLIEAISSGLPVICSGECGFADYVAASGSTVLSEPWSQEHFDLALQGMLKAHRQCLQHAIKYSRSVNFTGRADCAVDILEKFAAANKG